MTTPTKTYWTQEQLLASISKNGLDKNDMPLKDSYLKSSSYNLTSTFLAANPEIPSNLTGMLYKRFLGLLFSHTLTPAVYEDGTPQLTMEGKPKNYISSSKFYSLFPKTIKGNKVKLKATVQKSFKTDGLKLSS